MFSVDDPKTFGPARLEFADERDVDRFVDMLAQFERGEIDADAWRAFRLVHGVYGQRQDDWMMVRVKIPQGILGPAQLEALADVADRWSRGRGHVTTRQNVQFHFIRLEHVEAVLRRLAEAGLTTREACGNSIRNITSCPLAGTSPREPFDTTPHAEAMTRHLLRGPLSSTLPRKFKIAFGGCCGFDCTATAINDLGFLATTRDGRPGFRFTIGGGTATLPRSGFAAEEFLPAEQILEAAEAVVRVFHRLGNRTHKHQARLKYLIEKLGREAFLAEVAKERESIRAEGGRPLTLPAALPARQAPEAPEHAPRPTPDDVRFALHNVRPQKQEGFSTVIVRLPIGDVTSAQLRALADLSVRYGEGEVRTTHDQNLVLRFVPSWAVPLLRRGLQAAGLALPGARTAADVTSCPGAASCKLAVTASRGLAELLTAHFESRPELARIAGDLTLKISGCPNGCGQHHVAGLGFQGSMRKIDGRPTPHYLILLGGGVGPEGAAFGRPAVRVPARRVGEAVERLIRWYGRDRAEGESAAAFFSRVPAPEVQSLLKDLTAPATWSADDFVDLGQKEPFAVQVGAGECAQ